MERLRGEGFVDLEDVDLLEREPGGVESCGDG